MFEARPGRGQRGGRRASIKASYLELERQKRLDKRARDAPAEGQKETGPKLRREESYKLYKHSGVSGEAAPAGWGEKEREDDFTGGKGG